MPRIAGMKPLDSLVAQIRWREARNPVWRGQEVILHKMSYPLEIRYRDTKDVVTERPITVHNLARRFGPDGTTKSLFMVAFCEKRSRIRAFRLDRIEETIDGNTGEILDDLLGHLFDVAAERDRVPSKNTIRNR